jgi:hypothetical protein
MRSLTTERHPFAGLSPYTPMMLLCFISSTGIATPVSPTPPPMHDYFLASSCSRSGVAAITSWLAPLRNWLGLFQYLASDFALPRPHSA